jgi:hypothetical protein
MLSLESRLCFHWPRILYSLRDLIRFEANFASTNFLFLFILQMSFPYERCTKVCDKLVFIPLNDHREALKIVASPIMTTTTTAAAKNLPNQFPISISTRN